MFGTIKNRLLDGFDLAVEFSTLGEYRLDGPVGAGPASAVCSSSSFDWPTPCEGSARRRAAARISSADVC